MQIKVGSKVRFKLFGKLFEGVVVDIRVKSRRVKVKAKYRNSTLYIWRRFDQVEVLPDGLSGET